MNTIDDRGPAGARNEPDFRSARGGFHHRGTKGTKTATKGRTEGQDNRRISRRPLSRLCVLRASVVKFETVATPPGDDLATGSGELGALLGALGAPSWRLGAKLFLFGSGVSRKRKGEAPRAPTIRTVTQRSRLRSSGWKDLGATAPLSSGSGSQPGLFATVSEIRVFCRCSGGWGARSRSIFLRLPTLAPPCYKNRPATDGTERLRLADSSQTTDLPSSCDAIRPRFDRRGRRNCANPREPIRPLRLTPTRVSGGISVILRAELRRSLGKKCRDGGPGPNVNRDPPNPPG